LIISPRRNSNKSILVEDEHLDAHRVPTTIFCLNEGFQKQSLADIFQNPWLRQVGKLPCGQRAQLEAMDGLQEVVAGAEMSSFVVLLENQRALILWK
jgi:hypothetical protein